MRLFIDAFAHTKPVRWKRRLEIPPLVGFKLAEERDSRVQAAEDRKDVPHRLRRGFSNEVARKAPRQGRSPDHVENRVAVDKARNVRHLFDRVRDRADARRRRSRAKLHFATNGSALHWREKRRR